MKRLSRLTSPPDSPDADPLPPGSGERRRLAKTLHDSVCQSVTGAYWHASVIAHKLRDEESPTAGDMTRLVNMLHQVAHELRQVIGQLSSEEEEPQVPDNPSVRP